MSRQSVAHGESESGKGTSTGLGRDEVFPRWKRGQRKGCPLVSVRIVSLNRYA
jgi:hypothetical protein